MQPQRTNPLKETNALIAANLRRLAQQRGWTLERLAVESGVDKGNLYNALNGKINFTIRAMVKLSESLEVDIAELLKRQ